MESSRPFKKQRVHNGDKVDHSGEKVDHNSPQKNATTSSVNIIDLIDIDSIMADSIMAGSIMADSIMADSIMADSIMAGSIMADSNATSATSSNATSATSSSATNATSSSVTNATSSNVTSATNATSSNATSSNVTSLNVDAGPNVTNSIHTVSKKSFFNTIKELFRINHSNILSIIQLNHTDILMDILTSVGAHSIQPGLFLFNRVEFIKKFKITIKNIKNNTVAANIGSRINSITDETIKTKITTVLHCYSNVLLNSLLFGYHQILNMIKYHCLIYHYTEDISKSLFVNYSWLLKKLDDLYQVADAIIKNEMSHLVSLIEKF